MSTREYFDIVSMAKSFTEEMNRYCLENVKSFFFFFFVSMNSNTRTRLTSKLSCFFSDIVAEVNVFTLAYQTFHGCKASQYNERTFIFSCQYTVPVSISLLLEEIFIQPRISLQFSACKRGTRYSVWKLPAFLQTMICPVVFGTVYVSPYGANNTLLVRRANFFPNKWRAIEIKCKSNTSWIFRCWLP